MTNNNEYHAGERMRSVVEYLRKKKVSRKKFAELCGVSPVTVHFWYEMHQFSEAVSKKFDPVIKKYGINPAYLEGQSDKMLLKETPEISQRDWQNNVLKLLKEIRDRLPPPPPKT